jgi:hypothetical protein
MNNEMNINGIIGLAVATSMVQCGYHRDTNAEYLEYINGWDAVIELTITYLKWVGIDTDNVEIDKYVVAECFWGMVDDELDNKLAELEEDEAEEEEAFSY